METKELIKKAQDYITELGFEAKIYVRNFTPSLDVVEVGTIDAKSLGKFAPVFKEIEYEIKFGGSIKDNLFQIILYYNWKHPRGSNGYRVSVLYRDGELTVDN